MTKPKILILGWARHGKDTVAEILRDRHGFKFESSSHYCAQLVMMPYFEQFGDRGGPSEIHGQRHFHAYNNVEECYADRVNFRDIWFNQIMAFNDKDPARLAKAILEVGDIYVGMRSAYEFAEARKLFDDIWWVDASGRGLEPEDRSSMDIDCEDEFRYIDNNGSLIDLHYRVLEAVRDVQALGWARASIDRQEPCV